VPDCADEKHLACSIEDAEFPDPVAKQDAAGNRLLQQDGKQAKVLDQIVVNDPGRRIVGAQHQYVWRFAPQNTWSPWELRPMFQPVVRN
jgi:hypothetical protein